jgi:DNA replication protein DnaC
VGKTFLAEAIGHHACLNKKNVLFQDISTFLETLTLSRSTGMYLKLRDKLSRPDLLYPCGQADFKIIFF